MSAAAAGMTLRPRAAHAAFTATTFPSSSSSSSSSLPRRSTPVPTVILLRQHSPHALRAASLSSVAAARRRPLQSPALPPPHTRSFTASASASAKKPSGGGGGDGEGSNSEPVDIITMEKRAAHARAKMWLEGEGSKFENPSGSRDSNFVGGPRRPFPMNRFYVPIAPVRDETRTTIYERYMSDPKTQTPLKLAKEHKLSIARVQAILRLKALEASMRDAGKEVQEQLNEGMERMLITSSVQRMNEPLHVTPAERMKPLFQLLDEDQGVTPEDAAKLLKLEPFHAVQARLDVDAQRMFTIDPAAESRAKDVQTPPIAKDPVNASKFTFAFVDTSKPLDRPLYMRDRNGVFRKGSRYEKYRKEHPAPRFFL